MRFFLDRFPDGFLVHDLLKQLPPGTAFAEVLPLIRGGSFTSREKALFQRWAEIRPGEAAEFVAGHLDSVGLDSVEVLVNRWGGIKAGAAAADWTRSLPAGPVRDRAAKVLAFQKSKTQPELSWELATLISGDPDGGKTKLMQRIYDVWVSRDAAAANRALDALGAHP